MILTSVVTWISEKQLRFEIFIHSILVRSKPHSVVGHRILIRHDSVPYHVAILQIVIEFDLTLDSDSFKCYPASLSFDLTVLRVHVWRFIKQLYGQIYLIVYVCRHLTGDGAIKKRGPFVLLVTAIVYRNKFLVLGHHQFKFLDFQFVQLEFFSLLLEFHFELFDGKLTLNEVSVGRLQIVLLVPYL